MNMNKYYLLGASLVILLLSGLGAISAFSRPAQTAVSEKATLMTYQQQGTFGYEAKVLPGTFYGNAAASESIPLIPLSYIQRFDFDYSFSSDKAENRLVSIDARLESPGVWAKTINLVPTWAYAGNFRVSFTLDLDYLQQLADTINKEVTG